jgi:hypothetical protein
VVTYEERLHAPVSVWAVVWVLAATFGLAFGAALGVPAGVAIMLLLGGLVRAGLVRAAARVAVEGQDLVAGPARAPLSALGTPVPLDAETARHFRGPGSDPAAYHLIRGWVPAGVLLDVVDQRDPTPYWYVASRHPEALAAAVTAATSAHEG